MKIWQVLVLVVLLVSLPVLSACDLLGLGGESEEEKYYRQQLEAYRQQQEAYQTRLIRRKPKKTPRTKAS